TRAESESSGSSREHHIVPPALRAGLPSSPTVASQPLTSIWRPAPPGGSVPVVQGMTAPKNQKLLRLPFSSLGPAEPYLPPEAYPEVGTYQGKTLISALLGNPQRPAYACDNFSEFLGPDSRAILYPNLARSGLAGRVTFLDADFRQVLRPDVVPNRVGLYLYD